MGDNSMQQDRNWPCDATFEYVPAGLQGADDVP
jgi:hypothetical protein